MTDQKKTKRKIKTGTVVSSKMDKTVVVRIDRKMRHPKYEKVVMRAQKVYAHDKTNELKSGDVVTIMETRPISKLKRWCVVSK